MNKIAMEMKLTLDFAGLKSGNGGFRIRGDFGVESTASDSLGESEGSEVRELSREHGVLLNFAPLLQGGGLLLLLLSLLGGSIFIFYFLYFFAFSSANIYVLLFLEIGFKPLLAMWKSNGFLLLTALFNYDI